MNKPAVWSAKFATNTRKCVRTAIELRRYLAFMCSVIMHNASARVRSVCLPRNLYLEQLGSAAMRSLQPEVNGAGHGR